MASHLGRLQLPRTTRLATSSALTLVHSAWRARRSWLMATSYDYVPYRRRLECMPAELVSSASECEVCSHLPAQTAVEV